MPGKGDGVRPFPPRLGGSVRELEFVGMGAGDLGCPDGQRCAESQLPGGGGAAAANCCLLPEMPVLRGLAWGLFIAGGGAKQLPAWPHVEGAWTAAGLGRGMLEFYHRGGPQCPSGSVLAALGGGWLGMGRTRPMAALCPPPESQTCLSPPSSVSHGSCYCVSGLYLGCHRACFHVYVLRLVLCCP